MRNCKGGKKPLYIRLTEYNREQLETLAVIEERTLNDLINEAIGIYVNQVIVVKTSTIK